MDKYNKEYLRRIHNNKGLTSLSDDEREKYFNVTVTYQKRSRFNGIIIFGFLWLLSFVFALFSRDNIFELAIYSMLIIVIGTILLCFVIVTPINKKIFNIRYENERVLLERIQKGKIKL